MEPISLGHLRKLLLPSPRSHCSATSLGARSNQQPPETRSGKQLETLLATKTGQTFLPGLSLSQAGETGQSGLANRSG
jgi:hypothetical protein